MVHMQADRLTVPVEIILPAPAQLAAESIPLENAIPNRPIDLSPDVQPLPVAVPAIPLFQAPAGRVRRRFWTLVLVFVCHRYTASRLIRAATVRRIIWALLVRVRSCVATGTALPTGGVFFSLPASSGGRVTGISLTPRSSTVFSRISSSLPR